MKTWSLERAIVGLSSAAAVAVQGVFDTFTHRPAYANDHPIPGCPNPSDCREYSCAGDCHEALEAPTYDDDVPNPYEPSLTDDELIAVRHLLAWCNGEQSAKSSADGSAQEPAEHPPEVDPFPHSGPSGGPPLATWLEPAVMTMLHEHRPFQRRPIASEDDGRVYCSDDAGNIHRRFDDYQAWLEHVAPLITAHIARALPDYPGSLSESDLWAAAHYVDNWSASNSVGNPHQQRRLHELATRLRDASRAMRDQK